MKTLIICTSTHHKNTEKIALVMAEVLEAKLVKPGDISDPNVLADYDLIGFGSGIYIGKPHQSLIILAERLPQMPGKKCFLFCTGGQLDGGLINHYKKTLAPILEAKGFKIIGEFCCKGFDTFGPLKLIGGLNRNRPNQDDLANAKKFANSLISNEKI